MCSEEHQVFIPVTSNVGEGVYCGSVGTLYSVINPKMSEDEFRKLLYKLSRKNRPYQLTEAEYDKLKQHYFVTQSEKVESIYRNSGVKGLKEEITKYNERKSSLTHDELLEVMYILWENSIYLIWDMDEYPDIILTMVD